MANDAGSTGQVTIASGGSVHVADIVWDGYSQSGASGTATVTVASGGSLTSGKGADVGSGAQLVLSGGTVDAGTVSGTIANLAGGLITGYGTLAVPDGQAVVNNGIIRAAGGNLQIDESVTGTGTLQIEANSTATITGSTLKLAGIAFIGPEFDTVTGACGERHGPAVRLRDRRCHRHGEYHRGDIHGIDRYADAQQQRREC